MENAVSFSELNGSELEKRAVEYLSANKLTLAFAESCTGGLASKRIVDIPGASAVYLGGVVSYSNEVKCALLGVSQSTLAEHGAVSSETAVEMAMGVARITGADIGISITGIAGPASDDTQKPVGLVYIGVCRKGVGYSRHLNLSGYDRQTVRYLSASYAIKSIFDNPIADGDHV